MNKNNILKGIIIGVSIIFLMFVITVMTLSMPISYDTKSIRLMTWNVEWLFLESELPLSVELDGGSDLTTKIQRIARQIVKINPDICCLQEVSGDSVLNILRKTISQNYGIEYYTYIQTVGGIQKIAILSKFPIKNFKEFNNFVRFSVYWKEREFIIYGVHLKSRMDGTIKTEKDRINALKELYEDYMKFQNKPVLIMGDFNDNFGSNSMNYLSDRKLINVVFTKKYEGSFLDKYTYIIDRSKPVSIDNVRDLDHIFTNYKLYNNILDTFIDHSNSGLSDDEKLVSDHWPVVAIIQ